MRYSAILSLHARRALWALAVCCAALTPRVAVADTAPAGGRSTADVSLVIQAQKGSFHAGDPVVIRVGLTNTSATPITLDEETPWGGSVLLITDGNGAPIATVAHKDATTPAQVHTVSIDPKQTVWLTWDSKQYWPLDHWGYVLDKPGTYTIIGLPSVVGPNLTVDGSTLRSNTLTIRIEQ
jgi:hypothetical protein